MAKDATRVSWSVLSTVQQQFLFLSFFLVYTTLKGSCIDGTNDNIYFSKLTYK